MTEEQGFLVEAALHLGFEMTNDDGTEFRCTQEQLFELAERIRLKTISEAGEVAGFWGRMAAKSSRKLGVLRDAAREAAIKFREYELHHRAKPNLDKAKANARMAESLEKALEI